MPMAIAGALFAIGAPLAVVNFFAIGFGATLVSVALSVGLSLGASLLLRPPGAPSVKPSDGQLTIRQAVPPRWKSYGTVRVSGPSWWMAAENVNGKLYIGLAVNQGRIGGFRTYHIDDNVVPIDGTGQVTSLPYSGVTTKILTRLGEPTETKYSEILTDFEVDEVRGDGVATVLGIFDNFADAGAQLENYPNGQPRLRVTMDASVVFDPRKVSHDRLDQSTWEWSENPVVCLLDYMISPDGFALPWERIEANLDEWIEAMDVCDEKVVSLSAGGLVARYRLAGTFLFTDRPVDVVQRFLSTFDGRLWQRRDGTIGIKAGVYTQPSVTIEDREVLDFELTRGQDPLTAVAGIKAQYMSPPNDYREQDAEAWPDGETVAHLDEDRVINLDLLWVPDHGQARRLMKRRAVREAAQHKGTITCSLSALRAIDQPYIYLTLAELGLEAVSFAVDRFTIDFAASEVVMEVTQVGPEIDVFDAASEEGEAAGLSIRTAWQIETNNQAAGGRNSWSARGVIRAAKLSASGSEVRVRLEGIHGAGNTVLDHVAIVPRSGSTADGTGVPTEITFNGGQSGTVVPGNQEVVSDWVPFDFQVGVDYLLIIDYSPAGQAWRYRDDGAELEYLHAAAATYNVAAFPAGGGTQASIEVLNRIEVRG